MKRRGGSVDDVRRSPALVALALACTPATPPPPQSAAPPDPAPASPAPRAPSEPADTDTETLADWASACDGAAVKSALTDLTQAQLEALADRADDPDAKLLALWEAERNFGDDGKLDPAAAKAIVEAIARELGTTPPAWWGAHLASAHRYDTGVVYYDSARTKDGGDRQGGLVRGPGGSWIRPGDAMVLVESSGGLAIDLSIERMSLGPLPSKGQSLEVGRAGRGTTIYVARFEAATGGFRFPLTAHTPEGLKWSAEVCGPDRKILAGIGWLTVEISANKDTVLVFSAESHGVALDVFDAEDGARVFAWSSDFWFNRF